MQAKYAIFAYFEKYFYATFAFFVLKNTQAKAYGQILQKII